jgi:hypothetical protein
MRGLSYHQRPRKLSAQANRMRIVWPQFEFKVFNSKLIGWKGRVRGFQKQHLIQVLWFPNSEDKPYVTLRDPALRPREGATFDQIPHLLFYEEEPELSGLCLFDPKGGEWSNKQLIADTTIPWAAEWLLYYELWHFRGVWQGGGVGFESTAEARAATVYRETGKLADDAQGQAAVAS